MTMSKKDVVKGLQELQACIHKSSCHMDLEFHRQFKNKKKDKKMDIDFYLIKIINNISNIVKGVAKIGVGVLQAFIGVELIFGLIRNELNLLSVLTYMCLIILSVSMYWSMLFTDKNERLNK